MNIIVLTDEQSIHVSFLTLRGATLGAMRYTGRSESQATTRGLRKLVEAEVPGGVKGWSTRKAESVADADDTTEPAMTWCREGDFD